MVRQESQIGFLHLLCLIDIKRELPLAEKKLYSRCLCGDYLDQLKTTHIYLFIVLEVRSPKWVLWGWNQDAFHGSSKENLFPYLFHLALCCIPWLMALCSIFKIRIFKSLPASSYHLLCSQISLCLPLRRTFVIAFRVHPDKPGYSSHLKFLH